jgi:membrane-bound metal-dependent hydrolase YbcI (DUF457 family)
MGAATLAAAWAGAMLPDPDPDLAAARLYRRTLIERKPLVALAGALARLPVRLLALLPHRGLTYSLLACALATLLCGLLVWCADPGLAIATAVGAAIAYATHLAADACTPSGVPAWAPFSRRRTWLLPARARIRTGSTGEHLIPALLTALLCAAMLQLTA